MAASSTDDVEIMRDLILDLHSQTAALDEQLLKAKEELHQAKQEMQTLRQALRQATGPIAAQLSALERLMQRLDSPDAKRGELLERLLTQHRKTQSLNSDSLPPAL